MQTWVRDTHVKRRGSELPADKWEGHGKNPLAWVAVVVLGLLMKESKLMN